MISRWLGRKVFVRKSTPAKEKEPEEIVRRENLLWLLVAQALIILPLLQYLPIWLGAFWFVAFIWRIQIYRGRLPFPSLVLKTTVGFVGILGIYASFQGAKGIEPMVSLLVFAFSFKSIELRSRKDALLLVFIGFIVIAAQFLFSQNIPAAAIGILACIVLITTWETIYHRQTFRLLYKLKRGAWLLVNCVPLLLVFFVVTPRIGPLWSVPIPGKSVGTGFSDSLGIGDIGRLVRNSDMAFRVSFSGESRLPANKDMYWRGLVLDKFDGIKWRRSSKPKAPLGQFEVLARTAKNTIRYDVLMEPHHQPWLFALTTPVFVSMDSGRAEVTRDFLVHSSQDVLKKMQYTMVSAPNGGLLGEPNFSPYNYNLNTELPENFNPKTLSTGREWASQNLSSQEIIQKALNLYSRSFHYTLSPPLLGRNSIDEFLFETQRGFCEHFASSFVFLMRAAGVPARIVVGYQGGEASAIDNYYMVAQSDAHAWAEVWLENKGWLRVDPTAAVAPSRVEFGLSEALGVEDRANIGGEFWASNSFTRGLQHRWDAVGYAWTRWVLNYDTSKQQGIFRRLLGGIDPWRIGLAMLVVCACIVGLYFLLFWIFNRRVMFLSPELKIYNRFCYKLEKYQLIRKKNETPMMFSKRVISTMPYAKTEIENIESLFLKINYEDKKNLLEEFRVAVTKFPIKYASKKH